VTTLTNERRNTIFEIDVGYTKVVSVKLDIATLKELDEAYKLYKFRSRSELIREALSVYMALLKRYGREGVRKLLEDDGIDMRNPK